MASFPIVSFPAAPPVGVVAWRGRASARAAWQMHGLVMIRPEWLTTEWDREMLRTLAETAHGKRSE